MSAIALGAWFDYYDNFLASSLAVILPAAGVMAVAFGGVALLIGLFGPLTNAQSLEEVAG